MSEQTEWTGQMLESTRSEHFEQTKELELMAAWALAHAASRIADALETIAAPHDPQPLIEREREACATLAETANRIKWPSTDAALKDLAQAIRNRKDHQEA